MKSDSDLLVEDLPRVPENKYRRFAHIDALRAFAVVLVALFHAGASKAPGDSGVTVFFTISGFIITSLLLSERARTGGFRASRFYTRRFLKLAPPFLIAILLPSLIWAVIVPGASLPLLASEVLFSFNWALVLDPTVSSSVLPGTAVTWSLGVEEQFYIVFAVFWVLAVRVRKSIATLVLLAAMAVVCSSALRLYYLIADYPHSFTQFSTFARMDAIGLGALLAISLTEGGRRVRRWLIRIASGRWLIVAIVAYPLVGVPQWDWWESLVRPLLYPLITAIVIIFGILAPRTAIRRVFDRICANKLVTAVGVASYSIYLVHAVFFGFADAAFPQLTSVAVVLRVLLLVPLGCALGWLLYRVVEVPVLAWRSRRGL